MEKNQNHNNSNNNEKEEFALGKETHFLDILENDTTIENTKDIKKEETHNNHTSPDLEETNSTISDFIKFFRDIVILLIIAFGIRFFIISPFQIQGDSMENSYSDKEYILVDIFSYLDFNTYFNDILSKSSDPVSQWFFGTLKKIPIHIGNPKRGDVVVLRPHVDKEHTFYIKRVIGLPGETIKFSSGQVYIKGIDKEDFVQLNEPYLSDDNKGRTDLSSYITENEFKIPEGSYWIMGDNRNNSTDSRSCFKDCRIQGSSQFLKRGDIIGKVFIDLGYFNIFKEGEFPKPGSFSWIHNPRWFGSPSTAKYPELENN